MRIILLRSVVGIYKEKPYTFSKGSEVEVDTELGKDLTRGGNADIIGRTPAKKKETAKAKAKAKKETR